MNKVRKFVRVELPGGQGQELRFFSLDPQHSSQVKDGEEALGAGVIVVLKEGWRYVSKSSYTLNIEAGPEDSKMITETLGLPLQDELATE